MGIIKTFKNMIKENVSEDTINNIENKIGIDIDGIDNNITTKEKGAGKSIQIVENITFDPILSNDGYDIENKIYDFEDNIKYKVIQKFKIPHEFAKFSSGTNEIDCAFTYSETDDVEYSKQKPLVAIGFSEYDYEIIMEYKNTGKIPKNTKISKLENCIAEYKVEYTKNERYIIVYHYYRTGLPTLYYQIYLDMPVYLKNSTQGILAIKALNQIVSTYKEEKIICN